MSTQHAAHASNDVPRGMLIAAGVMIGMTILLAATARLTGVGEVRETVGAVSSERHLRFKDQPDGGIAVYEAGSDRLLERVAPGTNGFLRGTLRGLGRDRKREGVDRDTAFDLVGTVDGHLLLIDPSNNRRIDLGSFGPTNAAVFAHLLQNPGNETAKTNITGNAS